jgi:hypothetical protein
MSSDCAENGAKGAIDGVSLTGSAVPDHPEKCSVRAMNLPCAVQGPRPIKIGDRLTGLRGGPEGRHVERCRDRRRWSGVFRDSGYVEHSSPVHHLILGVNCQDNGVFRGCATPPQAVSNARTKNRFMSNLLVYPDTVNRRSTPVMQLDNFPVAKIVDHT